MRNSNLFLAAIGICLGLATVATAQERSKQTATIEVEVRTPLILKYLPNSRVIAVIPPAANCSLAIHDRRANKDITLGLNEVSWVSNDSDKQHSYTCPRGASDFIATLGIHVDTAETCVEVTKLVEEITTVADTIRNTMFNANDWHFFDGRPYTSLPSPPWPEPHLERWEYRAERSNEMWVVNVRYHAVGTESIMHPPRYQILLKDGDEFKEIREVFY